MRVYECYFSTVDNNLIIEVCKADYFLSWQLYLEFLKLEPYDSGDCWIDFIVTKQDIQSLNCEDFVSDDWWFIRTLYDCFGLGYDRIHICMWEHIYLFVG